MLVKMEVNGPVLHEGNLTVMPGGAPVEIEDARAAVLLSVFPELRKAVAPIAQGNLPGMADGQGGAGSEDGDGENGGDGEDGDAGDEAEETETDADAENKEPKPGPAANDGQGGAGKKGKKGGR